METIIYPKEVKANKEHRCDFCLQPIFKKEKYLHSVHKFDGDIYAWRSHINCQEIASKLKMFDYADEGVNDEFFSESIKEEYSNIMSKHFNELYESKGFVIPIFKERLDFVIDFHLKKKEPSDALNIVLDNKHEKPSLF